MFKNIIQIIKSIVFDVYFLFQVINTCLQNSDSYIRFYKVFLMLSTSYFS